MVLLIARIGSTGGVAAARGVLLMSTSAPLAVLKLPVVFKRSATYPLAVLYPIKKKKKKKKKGVFARGVSVKERIGSVSGVDATRGVFFFFFFFFNIIVLGSALSPLAVLLSPVVLLKSASTPLAVLSLPVVLKRSALTHWPCWRYPWCC